MVKRWNNIKGQRVRASALGMALIISLLVAVLCGFFVMQSHLDRVEELHYGLKQRLDRNCDSGIQFLLSKQGEVMADQSIPMDLFDTGQDSVLLIRKAWGVYEIIGAKAHAGKQTAERFALIGSAIDQSGNRTGLWINDLDKPLSICGRTMLNGKTYLPDEGVKRAYIEGQNYVGEKLVYGQQLQSERHLPELEKGLLQSINNRLAGNFDLADSIETFIYSADSVGNSFLNSTLVLKSDGTLITGDMHIRGNVCLYSTSEIFVSSLSHLDGIICIAPNIEIEQGFKGKIQAFATKHILIGEGVQLDYPSALGLFSSAGTETDCSLEFQPGCTISGSVIVYSTTHDNDHLPLVRTTDDFVLKGELYVDGRLDLKGTVQGSVWCHKLVLKTNSGVYENHLLNVTVDPTLLSTHYLGAACISNTNRSILQWI